MNASFEKSPIGKIVITLFILVLLLLVGYLFIIKPHTATSPEDNAPKTNTEGKKTKPESSPTKKIEHKGKIALNDEQKRVEDVMASPEIKVTPESKQYLYSYNDRVKLKAIAVENESHSPKNPVYCKWEGVSGYTGNSCEPIRDVQLETGENTIKVTMCDEDSACATAEKKIEVEYKDPMLSVYEGWDNYVINGKSGEWKFDEKSKTVYSTKNVRWSGFWNPDDLDLEDYQLSFKMMVSSPSKDDDSIGFTFRMKDADNFYFFVLDNRNSNDGAIHSGLYKNVDGIRTRLVDLMDKKWKLNKWNYVRIKVDGSQIEVWLDGELVANTFDTSFNKGGYGPFSVSQSYATFKDLKVTFE